MENLSNCIFEAYTRGLKKRCTSLKTNYELPNYELSFFCNRTSSTMQTFSKHELTMLFFQRRLMYDVKKTNIELGRCTKIVLGRWTMTKKLQYDESTLRKLPKNQCTNYFCFVLVLFWPKHKKKKRMFTCARENFLQSCENRKAEEKKKENFQSFKLSTFPYFIQNLKKTGMNDEWQNLERRDVIVVSKTEDFI